MLIIPAIDLSGGRCVRLLQGRRERVTDYSSDPVEMARRWQQEGAGRLHLVDLDGAFDGSPQNKKVIAEIVKAVRIPVQLGGGLRDLEGVREAFHLGVDKVILGTVAAADPALLEKMVSLFGPRLIVAIDAREGMVAIRGWIEKTGLKAVELARCALSLGLREIIYTDISRDGMMTGPNLDALEQMTSVKGLDIIASGGIARLEDIRDIGRLEREGVSGAIVGKALYEGRFTLEEALAMAAHGDGGESRVTKRIIPCLDVKEGRVVKGVEFAGLEDAGDPVEMAHFYDRAGADELVLLQIAPSSGGEALPVSLVEKITKNIAIPLIVGGGISRLDHVDALLKAGAARVSLNTAAGVEPGLIDKIAGRFGSGRLVISIDAGSSREGRRWELFTHGGMTPTGRHVLPWAREVERRGAGEILLTCIERDGGRAGYDLELTAAVAGAVGIPVIASGGAGAPEHFWRVLTEGRASAALAASLFHERALSIKEVKEYLADRGVEVRGI